MNMRRIIPTVLFFLLCLTAKAQLSAPVRPRVVEYFFEAGYVMPHTTPLAASTTVLKNDDALCEPGLSAVAGFRSAIGKGFYGGMEYGLLATRGSRSYEVLDYNTIFDEEKRYYQCEDLTTCYALQFTPLMVGYAYELLDWLAVDLHAGLNFHFSPFATRYTVMTSDEDVMRANGKLGWDQFDHFGYCLKYGFRLVAGGFSIDASMRGWNGAQLSVGYSYVW